MRVLFFAGFVLAAIVSAPWLTAQDAPQTPSVMTLERMSEILRRIDPQLKGEPGFWSLTHDDLTAQVVVDTSADRMRIMIPITGVEGLSQEQLYRLLQANFESALDARYAIAQGLVWSTFIHPLSSLDDAEFVSGIAQTFNSAQTYGTSFSSGLFNFGGGDKSRAFNAIKEKGLRL